MRPVPSGVVLALDAGGSTTRALVLDPAGHPLGRAASGPGNPSAVGVEAALVSVREAVSQALAGAGAAVADVRSTVLASAGSDRLVPRETLIGHLGLDPGAPFRRVSDLLAMFHSAADTDTGAALVAGTGSVAARVRGGGLERVVGGNGWLLGDAGAGFWIGREVARAVTDDLDGTGAVTALTPALLAEFGLSDDRRPREGRAFVLGEIVDLVHAAEPVRLARLAPACFTAAAAGDSVATAIVAAAQEELAVLVRAVEGPGPLVVGGGVWRRSAQGPLAPGLRAALTGRTVLPAEDGLLGAASLALRALGLPTAPLRALRGTGRPA
ncbi:N-acetylglucosamine kinase [Kineococcus sp. LSe6-4]|uniref:N-acetylglucosamine kinase n=1 Tax=Kineococcus halophytocola TaxID=3234027 RepID=A0ABV4H0I3_9ACTN